MYYIKRNQGDHLLYLLFCQTLQWLAANEGHKLRRRSHICSEDCNFCLINTLNESVCVSKFSFVLLMITLVCDIFVIDVMPALATAQAGNDLDTLTLFCGTQTGGPALFPGERRIWILHEWLRHSILHPASHSPLVEPHKAHHVSLSAEVQTVPLGWYRTGGDGAPIHLPLGPDDGSIGCPLPGSEHSHEDGLVGQLTKGGKACR